MMRDRRVRGIGSRRFRQTKSQRRAPFAKNAKNAGPRNSKALPPARQKDGGLGPVPQTPTDISILTSAVPSAFFETVTVPITD